MEKYPLCGGCQVTACGNGMYGTALSSLTDDFAGEVEPCDVSLVGEVIAFHAIRCPVVRDDGHKEAGKVEGEGGASGLVADYSYLSYLWSYRRVRLS